MTVLEFSQYLAGPYAGLRLADMGARVIKIERPNGGDPCRQLALKNILVDGDSLVFHAVNRGKESVALDLKNPSDLVFVKRLIARADVMTHNFRPGVMEKLGLSYEEVKKINPSIIYGAITGYGKEGPWRSKPGQDLLAQSLSGLTWLTGDAGDPPVPFGLAVADMMCGTHFAQAIIAALIQRARIGEGVLVEVSLMESLIDFQFEGFTTFFNDNGRLPQRAEHRNAHAYLGAPYGIYDTRDGYIAIAMGSLVELSSILGCDALLPFTQTAEQAFDQRDEIHQILAAHLKRETTQFWLERLEADDFWCSDVYTYAQLLKSAGYRHVAMEQTVYRPGGDSIRTFRCPIRFDGERLYSSIASPRLGNSTEEIRRDLQYD
jgi:crotonobetainyl-CoA:carnitine CoA-transferase CaiB-like acyl-CoA transferase